MSPTHTIGFVWPGPSVPGDAEEVARFIPDGVDWHIAGTPRDTEADITPAITRDRLFAMAENPNIEATAAKTPRSRRTGHRLRLHIRQLRARGRRRRGHLRPHHRRDPPPLDNDLDHGSRGAQATGHLPRSRPLAACR